MTDYVLQAEDVAIHYGGVKAVDGVALTLEKGQIRGLIGPNGAGKSSLLLGWAGLLEPTAGDVRLDGASLASLHPRARAQAIGYLPQTPDIAWDVSVDSLVALGRLPWKGAPGDDAISEAIAAMDLQGLRHRSMSEVWCKS